MSKMIPINQQAAALFNKYVAAFDRVLILGAGGWFGKTTVAMLDPELLTQKDFSFIGQNARLENVNSQSIAIECWSDEILARRQPDLVIDFAFLTKNFAKVWGVDRYNQMNKEISERLIRIAKFDSVRCVVSASSGAAIQPKVDESLGSTDDSYGDQKKVNETELQKISEWRGIAVSIARAWSVTGGFVRRPEMYAFSDFIQSVQSKNAIAINSSHPVFRRYCAVEDLLALSTAEVLGNNFTVVESGGPLLELRELASLVASQVGNQATMVHAPDQDSSAGDHYYSDGQSWSQTITKHSFQPLDLSEQIQNVTQAIKIRLKTPPIV